MNIIEGLMFEFTYYDIAVLRVICYAKGTSIYRETDRDIETVRQRETETGKERDRQTAYRQQRERERERNSDRHTDRDRNSARVKQMQRQ